MAPEPVSLASVVMKILCLGMSAGSIVVRHAGDMTRVFISSNVTWCRVVHGGKCLSHSFFVSLSSTVVCSAIFGKKTARYRTRPRNPQTCFALVGAGQYFTQSALPSSASIPLAETQWPKKWILVEKSFVFFRLQYKLFSFRAVRIVLTLCSCSSNDLDHIAMSSM